jgi:hypothetical protein
MGRVGTLAAMNRHNMESLGSSLLQRASFEQSLDVFEEGAAFGRSDPLAGATERIITGQPVGIGTGLMGIKEDSSLVPYNQDTITLVAPMGEPFVDTSMEDVGPSIHVKGLYDVMDEETIERISWDPSMFATKLADLQKIPSLPFLEECATQFRTTAAMKRQVPNLSIRVRLSKKLFEDTKAKCDAWGPWSSVEDVPLLTEVVWSSQEGTTQSHGDNIERYGKTQSVLGRPSSSWTIESFQNETYKNVQYEIYVGKQLDPMDTPFGVQAKEIIMRNQKVYHKGLFKLTLCTEYKGVTNVDAEQAILHGRGTAYAILELLDAEAILQSRCSDAQLSNAFACRLPL